MSEQATPATVLQAMLPVVRVIGGVEDVYPLLSNPELIVTLTNGQVFRIRAELDETLTEQTRIIKGTP